MQTPEEMQKEIDEEIKNYVEEIKEERKRLDRASEWISGLESDLSEAQLDFEDAAKIIKKSKQELERLNNIHVFREADKETKAIRDIQQKKIMVVVGCQT
jgi:predicted  nucleic acid-binding Zn-ribbon protein